MMKFILIFIFTITLLIFTSCGQDDFMDYEVVFYTTLGTNQNEVGSNIPLLKPNISDDHDFMIGDYLDVPTGVQYFRNKIYIADNYNNRVEIFSIEGDNFTTMNIPSIGEGYEFETPFELVLNKYGEIYVLASAPNSETNENDLRYYIYKFSIEGKFVYRLGIEGLNSAPMAYPYRINMDLFDNIYVYFKDYTGDNLIWTVKRYSQSGELNFEFDTTYLSLTNIIGNETYAAYVNDVYNLKNDERLLIYNAYTIVSRDNVKLETPDKFYHSLSVYSILQNSITTSIFNLRHDIDGMLAVTGDDEIVMYAYDEKIKGIHFRFIDFHNEEEEMERIYYAPLLTDINITVSYFVDLKGDIYSVVIKDNKYFVILRWIKPKNIQA